MDKETIEYWNQEIKEHPVLKKWQICDNDEVIEKYPFLEKAVKNFNRWKQTVIFLKKENNEGVKYRMVIYTPLNVYYFYFSDDYMNCGYDRRAENPLESHKRGGDLADGRATRETLLEILCDIMAIEAVQCIPFTVTTDEDGNNKIVC